MNEEFPQRNTESTRNQFSMAVEKKAMNEKKSYLSALSEVMRECSLEPETVAKLINNSLKEKIKAECVESRVIRTEKRVPNLMEILV